MCGRSSLLFSQTSHPSAGPKELTNPHISLFTPLIHSFNSFPADSLVSKLTRQQLAIRLQEHRTGREGMCRLHHGGRRKRDSLLVIFQPPAAFPGTRWSKKLRQEHAFMLCDCMGPLASTAEAPAHFGSPVLNNHRNNSERQLPRREQNTKQSKAQGCSSTGLQPEPASSIHSL